MIDMKAREISNHSLKLYERCPHQYYLNYHTDTETNKIQNDDFLEKGKIVHEVLEKLRKKPKKKYIEQFLSTTIRNTEYTPNINEEVEIKKMLREWIDSRDLSAKVISTECSFNVKVNDDFSIKGYIDVVEKVDTDFLRVRDYKTGNNFKDLDDVYNSSQLMIYSLAVMEKFDVNRVEAGFDQLKFEPPTFVEYSKPQLYKFIKHLTKVQNKIANDINHKPRMGKHCAWCNFNHTCKFIKNLNDHEELKNMPLEKMAKKYKQYSGKEKVSKKRKDELKDMILKRLEKANRDSYDGKKIKVSTAQREYEYYRPSDILDVLDEENIDDVLSVKKSKLKDIFAPEDLKAIQHKKKKGHSSKYIKVTEKKP